MALLSKGLTGNRLSHGTALKGLTGNRLSHGTAFKGVTDICLLDRTYMWERKEIISNPFFKYGGRKTITNGAAFS